MAVPKQWKIAGAAVAVAGLGIGGISGASDRDDEAGAAPAIRLRDALPATTLPAPVQVDAPMVDDAVASPDGESLDSPLQSADDSPHGPDSLDSPEAPPVTEAVPPVVEPAPEPPPAPAGGDSPDDSPDASAQSEDSPD